MRSLLVVAAWLVSVVGSLGAILVGLACGRAAWGIPGAIGGGAYGLAVASYLFPLYSRAEAWYERVSR